MTLTLTLACGPFDRTLPLLDGSVTPDGIRLEGVALTPGQMFRRQARDAEFDVCEFSLSTYTMLRGQGDRRFVAIPAFPSRFFRHRSIYINTHAGIRRPEDLVGRRVGCAEYQQTASTWARGILETEYGVRPDQIEWYLGAFNRPGPYHERSPVTLPATLRTTLIREDQCLDQLLESGELDAIVAASEPASYLRGSPDVDRLFPDYPAVEADYFRRTGIFPIMHTVVVRQSILDAEPWAAASLYAAFVEAKRLAMGRMAIDGPASRGLPWFERHVEETTALMGPDPYAYGYSASLPVVSAFLAISHAQGLTPALLDPADLFVAELLES